MGSDNNYYESLRGEYMIRRKGGTIIFDEQPIIISHSATVGRKEHEGPLGKWFSDYFEDELCGESTFEKAESRLQYETVERAVSAAGKEISEIDCIFGGDLLNQCIGSNYGLRGLGIPFLGAYGACSTMALTLIEASVFVASGAANIAAAVTSSHFCSAERQFRFPLEYGNQRTPLAQWTVTGAGCALVSKSGEGPVIKAAVPGRICDLGVTDINNMGAAMAPAAADTVERFLTDTGTAPSDYDMILTGDLGFVGAELFTELMDRKGISVEGIYTDCGTMIYDRKGQDVHSGGSGCGCSASVLCGRILSELDCGTLDNILFCATGALMSPTTVFQGESIPGIAHLINIGKK